MDNIASIAWPMVRLPEAIEVLARRAGLKPAPNGNAVRLHLVKPSNQEEFESWLDWICARIGIEIEPVETTASDFSDMLRGAGPALLRHQHRGEPLILLLLKATARSIHLIRPDLKVKRYPLHIVQAAICAEREKPVRVEVESFLQHTTSP